MKVKKPNSRWNADVSMSRSGASSDQLSLRPEFTGRIPLWFVGVHFIVGALLQIFDFGRSRWVGEFFLFFDAVFPAFRTIFHHSPNPIGCKLFLLIWWSVLLPLGLWLALRFLSRFELDASYRDSVAKVISIFVFGALLVLVVLYLNSFKEYSLVVPSSISRLNIQYLILKHGPMGVSIYLCCCSIVAIVGVCLAYVMAKLFFLSGKYKG